MIQGSPIPKSLVEQILDGMFAEIGRREAFDEQVIQKLKQLAASGELAKPPAATQAIKSPSAKKP